MEVAGSARLQTGTVLELDSTSLTLQTESGATITYPIELIRRLEVSAGAVEPGDDAARGMVTGVVVGAGLVSGGLRGGLQIRL